MPLTKEQRVANLARGRAEATARRRAERTGVSLDPLKTLDAAVANLQTMGGFIALFAPHLGVTIAGVQAEEAIPQANIKKGEWIVKSRAQMVGNMLRARVQHDPNLVRLLATFNRLFDVPEALVVATSIPAALAVDTGRMNAETTINVPMMGKALQIQPIKMAIGDVVDYIEMTQAGQGEAQSPAPETSPSPNGRPVEQEVAGGVEAT